MGALSAGLWPGQVRGRPEARWIQVAAFGQCLGSAGGQRPCTEERTAAWGTPSSRVWSDCRGLFTVHGDRQARCAGVHSPKPRVSGRFRRHPIRPVLKHGPRSLTCVRVTGWQTHGRNESEGWLRSAQVGSRQRAHHRPVSISTPDEAEQEHTRWDPKDGELCLSRTKPEETLVEVRSDSDVQIDRQTWV